MKSNLIKALAPVLLLLSCASHADTWYAGTLHDETNKVSTFEIGGNGMFGDHTFGQAALFSLSSEGKRHNGANFSLSYAIGNPLRLYSGIGLFWGEHKDCEYINYREVCDHSDHAVGFYPEIGAMMNIGDVQIGAYARHYAAITGDNATMYGFRLGMKM